MTVYCECCDLDEASCGKAAEDKQRSELAQLRALLLTRGWIQAGYPGYCVRCGDPFKPGVCIKAVLSPFGATAWVAECCAQGVGR
jgi:hypothetical protein